MLSFLGEVRKMRKRLLCLVLLAAVFGMCLSGIQADPTLRSPIAAQTVHASQTLAFQPVQFLPQTVPATPPEGGGQEQQVQPQQQPKMDASL